VIGAPSALDSAVAKIAGKMVFETRSQYKTTQTGSKYPSREPEYKTQAVEQLTLTPAEAKKYVLPTRESQAFNLTAEEKIAWDKTRVNLAAAMPELKKLSDKAITEKIMDRQWIADTISTLREKDRIFTEIAQKSAANRVASDAANQAALKRELALNQLMDLQDKLTPARPVSSTAQGPKTREAQRNQLAPVYINLNNMARPDKP
jgi:hypothetical protein